MSGPDSELDLSGRGLSRLPEAALDGTLRTLRAARNRLLRLPPLARQAPKLELLDLSGNRLVVMDGVEGLSRLHTLALSANSISGVAEALPSLPALQRLDLARNTLSCVPGAALSGCGALRELDLGGNTLSDMPPLQLPLLEALELRANLLPGAAWLAPPAALPRLRRLGLAENRVARAADLAALQSVAASLQDLAVAGNPFAAAALAGNADVRPLLLGWCPALAALDGEALPAGLPPVGAGGALPPLVAPPAPELMATSTLQSIIENDDDQDDELRKDVTRLQMQVGEMRRYFKVWVRAEGRARARAACRLQAAFRGYRQRARMWLRADARGRRVVAQQLRRRRERPPARGVRARRHGALELEFQRRYTTLTRLVPPRPPAAPATSDCAYRQHFAATAIQRVARGAVLRARLARVLRQARAAVCIQSRWRGALVRDRYAGVGARARAARELSLRAQLTTLGLRVDALQTAVARGGGGSGPTVLPGDADLAEAAAAAVQDSDAVRRLAHDVGQLRLQLRKSERERAQQEEALRFLWEEVARLQRDGQARDDRSRRRAALRLQRAWRGARARRHFRLLRGEFRAYRARLSGAATCIQRHARGMLSRAATMRLLVRRHRAETVQTAARTYLAQKRFVREVATQRALARLMGEVADLRAELALIRGATPRSPVGRVQLAPAPSRSRPRSPAPAPAPTPRSGAAAPWEDPADDDGGRDPLDVDAEQAVDALSLVDVWTEAVDPRSGKPFFHNRVTGVSTWIRPRELQSPGPPL